MLQYSPSVHTFSSVSLNRFRLEHIYIYIYMLKSKTVEWNGRKCVNRGTVLQHVLDTFNVGLSRVSLKSYGACSKNFKAQICKIIFLPEIATLYSLPEFLFHLKQTTKFTTCYNYAQCTIIIVLIIITFVINTGNIRESKQTLLFLLFWHEFSIIMIYWYLWCNTGY